MKNCSNQIICELAFIEKSVRPTTSASNNVKNNETEENSVCMKRLRHFQQLVKNSEINFEETFPGHANLFKSDEAKRKIITYPTISRALKKERKEAKRLYRMFKEVGISPSIEQFKEALQMGDIPSPVPKSN